ICAGVWRYFRAPSTPADPRAQSDARSLVEPPKSDSSYSSGIGGKSAATVNSRQADAFQPNSVAGFVGNGAGGARSGPPTVADPAAVANIEGFGKPGD